MHIRVNSYLYCMLTTTWATGGVGVLNDRGFGIFLILTLYPCDLSKYPSDADDKPLPSDETTPPVINMNLVTRNYSIFGMSITSTTFLCWRC